MQTLSMCQTKASMFGNEGCKALAEALKANYLRGLKEVNVRDNGLGDKGALALAGAILSGYSAGCLIACTVDDASLAGQSAIIGAYEAKYGWSFGLFVASCFGHTAGCLPQRWVRYWRGSWQMGRIPFST